MDLRRHCEKHIIGVHIRVYHLKGVQLFENASQLNCDEGDDETVHSIATLPIGFTQLLKLSNLNMRRRYSKTIHRKRPTSKDAGSEFTFRKLLHACWKRGLLAGPWTGEAVLLDHIENHHGFVVLLKVCRDILAGESTIIIVMINQVTLT